MHTLGHLATTHCVISIFDSAKKEALLIDKSSLLRFPNVQYEGHTSPLIWSVTKGGLSFSLVLVADWCYFLQAVCPPWPVLYSI